MRVPSRGGLAAVCLVMALSACAGAKMASSAMSATAPSAEVAPPPLDRSLFARDPEGHLSEDDLQKILAAPIELALPARVGVLPIITAEDWRGPNPDYTHIPAGTPALVKDLRGAEDELSLVTDVMPIPSGALGMEALREIAGRYRLRYVVLYREMFTTHDTVSAIAWGYLTVLGALFLPGQDLEVQGVLEASLFDVKTGTLLFTTRRAVRAERRSNVFYNQYKLDRIKVALATQFAPDLARDFRSDMDRFAAAAKRENPAPDRVADQAAPAASVAAAPAPANRP